MATDRQRQRTRAIRTGHDDDGHGRVALGVALDVALDVAATEFYDAEKKLYTMDGKAIDSAAMVDFLADWVENYPICSVEDGCSEDDWDGWKLMSERLGDKVTFAPEDMWVPSGTALLSAHAYAHSMGTLGDGDPAAVLPVYTRLSDAEENEKLRGGGGEQ